ncbi:MAG: hypothetical protein WB996_00870 [Ignavibacteriaceae bacterium]
MKKSQKTYYSFYKEITLSIASLVVIYLFIGFTTSVKNVNTQNEKVLASNKETLQDEYNCDYFDTDNVSFPVHSVKRHIYYNLKFTLDDVDEKLDLNKVAFNTVSDDNFIQVDFDNFTRNILNKELIIDTKYPTEKALRSDILII